MDEGDVVVGFDHHPISGIYDLHRLLTEERVGVRVRLRILRGDETLTCEVVPGEARDDF